MSSQQTVSGLFGEPSARLIVSRFGAYWRVSCPCRTSAGEFAELALACFLALQRWRGRRRDLTSEAPDFSVDDQQKEPAAWVGDLKLQLVDQEKDVSASSEAIERCFYKLGVLSVWCLTVRESPTN